MSEDLLERRLRETLVMKADAVRVDSDAYATITARVRAPRWWELRWVRAAVVGLAAGAVVAVALPGALELLRPEPARVLFTEPPAVTETTAAPEPTIGSPPTTAPVPPVGDWTWARAPEQDSLAPAEFTTMADVARVEDSYVAVGATNEGAAQHEAVWTSTDGVAWDCVDCEGHGSETAISQLLAVTPFEGGFLAVGETYEPDEPSSPVVRTAVDERIVLEGEGAMRDVVSTTAGLVAVGEVVSETTRTPAVWRSDDGRTWEAQVLEGSGAAEGTLDHVAVVGDLVVALARDGGVHVSDDGGASWSYVAAAETGFSEQATAFEDLVALDERFFAVTVSTEEGPLAYASDATGRSWELNGAVVPAVSGGPPARVSELLVAPDGTLVAAGLTPAQDGGVRAAAWTSTDLGTTWTEVPSDDFVAGTQLAALTTGPDGLVAVGQEDDADLGSIAATWTANP